MSLRRVMVQRSPLEWGIRAGLAAGAAVIGYGAVTHSLAFALERRHSVERAHYLAPSDGRITAALSETLMGPDASSLDRAGAERLARAAVQLEPTATDAVTTLGLNAELHGDLGSARRLLAYSEALSRRDLRTQLWAIQDAVNRGDVTGALRHYDFALRTSRNASSLLFPVLASAITEPSIQSALVHTLVKKPEWSASFIDYVAGNSPDPLATSHFFRALRNSGVEIPDISNATAVNALIAADRFDDAWAYYATLRSGADRRVSRDRNFTATGENPLPFDWVLSNNEGIITSMQASGHGGVFDFSAPASVGGLLLRQVQLLPPGNYVLEGKSAAIDLPQDSRPYWTLTCSNGRELGRVNLNNSDQANGVFVGRFTVPENCAVQYLSLIARPSDAISGVSGQIEQVLLHPAR